MPNSEFIYIWKLIILITLLTLLFYNPLIVAFQNSIESLVGNNFYVFKLLPFIILTIDILLNFNTSYYEEGLLVLEREKIIKHYT